MLPAHSVPASVIYKPSDNSLGSCHTSPLIAIDKEQTLGGTIHLQLSNNMQEGSATVYLGYWHRYNKYIDYVSI